MRTAAGNSIESHCGKGSVSVFSPIQQSYLSTFVKLNASQARYAEFSEELALAVQPPLLNASESAHGVPAVLLVNGGMDTAAIDRYRTFSSTPARSKYRSA